MRPAFKLAPIVVGKATFIAIKLCFDVVYLYMLSATYARYKWSNMEITGTTCLLTNCIFYLFALWRFCLLLSIWVTVRMTLSKCELTILYWTFGLTWNKKEVYSKLLSCEDIIAVSLSHDSWCYSSLRLKRTVFVQLVICGNVRHCSQD